MNKNTARRLRAYRAKCKKEGFPAYVHKRKVRPFPIIPNQRRFTALP